MSGPARNPVRRPVAGDAWQRSDLSIERVVEVGDNWVRIAYPGGFISRMGSTLFGSTRQSMGLVESTDGAHLAAGR